MKTIYSLKEFHQKAVEISGKETIKCWVRVEYTIHQEYIFECFIEGHSMVFRGNTVEDALNKLRQAVSPKPKLNIDVEIDIQEEPTHGTIIMEL